MLLRFYYSLQIWYHPGYLPTPAMLAANAPLISSDVDICLQNDLRSR